MQSTLPCFNRHSNIHLQASLEPLLEFLRFGFREVKAKSKQTWPAFVRCATPGFYLAQLRINFFHKDINMVTKKKIFTINRPVDMNITTSQKQGRVPVTILKLAGMLDSSNYTLLVDEAKKTTSTACVTW